MRSCLVMALTLVASIPCGTDEVGELAHRLGSEDPREREQATRELVEHARRNPDAWRPLLEHEDREVAARAFDAFVEAGIIELPSTAEFLAAMSRDSQVARWRAVQGLDATAARLAYGGTRRLWLGFDGPDAQHVPEPQIIELK